MMLHKLLMKFGRFLRLRWILFIAKKRNYSLEKIEQTFGRFCPVCYIRFVPRFTHHYLCNSCQETFIVCWNIKCSSVYKPYKGWNSDTYCYDCRIEGKAKDLMQDMIEANKISIDVLKSSKGRRHRVVRQYSQGGALMTAEEFNEFVSNLKND